MNKNFKSHHPVLDLAWKRFAELDANSMVKKDQYMKQRRWIIVLAIMATLFAILVDGYGDYLTGLVGEIIRWVLQILLIMTPILSSAIAAFSNKFQQGQKYLAMRGAAEEMIKNMYLYRTVLQGESDRHKWLNERLAAIQRNMFKAVSGELVLKPYTGNIPPYHDPQSDCSDPGFTDLSGEQYLAYRLEDQLAWHIKQNQKIQGERMRIQILILTFGGLGALLAALGSGFSIWVALTSSFVAAYVGWEDLRGLDLRVTNYSRVILELILIRDHWLTLDEQEKTSEEFIKLVRGTEQVLWTQHSEFMKAMQDEFAESGDREAELIENVIQKSRDASVELQQIIFDEAKGVVTDVIETATERVALGVEDSAAAVTEGMSRIAGEVEDYYEAKAAAMVVEAEGFVDEVFGDVGDKDITAAVDAALAESVAFDEDEDFEDEVFVDDDFEDESFEDTAEAVVGEIFEDEVFEDEEFVDETFDDEEFVDEVFG